MWSGRVPETVANKGQKRLEGELMEYQGLILPSTAILRGRADTLSIPISRLQTFFEQLYLLACGRTFELEGFEASFELLRTRCKYRAPSFS
jgi:hypothetical protein